MYNLYCKNWVYLWEYLFSGYKEILSNVIVTLGNCTTSRCSLKRNSTMHIEIQFLPGLLFVCNNTDTFIISGEY